MKVKVGDIISVADAKHGTSDHGPWYLVPVKAEKGYDRITVWAANALEAAEIIGDAKIEKITEVEITNRQVNGEWYKQTSCRAELKQAPVDKIGEPVDDSDLPFMG